MEPRLRGGVRRTERAACRRYCPERRARRLVRPAALFRRRLFADSAFGLPARSWSAANMAPYARIDVNMHAPHHCGIIGRNGVMAEQEPPADRVRRADIQAGVDRVVATHGAYIPVELLLTLGRLRYTDYDAWRCGGQASLQSALTGSPNETADLLKDAAEWARTLGLQPEVRDYFGWGRHARHQLVFFHDGWHEADRLLATHYIRARESAAGEQLDLFLDSSTTVALQDLRAALRARDPEAAQRYLANLDANAPEHGLRPAARRLIDALRGLSASLHRRQAPTELAAVEQDLLPAARDLLGPGARDLMVPFWHRLAAALTGAPFDPERPELHASYACVRALDWRGAVAAIEAQPDYATHPALLERLAQARYHDGQYSAAIMAWSALCWLCARTAEAALDDLPPTAGKLRTAWVDFRDLDIEPAPDAGLFPARLLLAEPGLAHAVPPDIAAGDSIGEHAFRAVHQLLQDDCTDTRKAVQDVAPWLLAAYLDLRVPA